MGARLTCPACFGKIFPPNPTAPNATPSPAAVALSADESPADESGKSIVDQFASGTEQHRANAENQDLTASLTRIEGQLEAIFDRLPIAASFLAKEYKLLEVWTKPLQGTFDNKKLEEALNAHSQDGWVVKSMVEYTVPSLTGAGKGILIILER